MLTDKGKNVLQRFKENWDKNKQKRMNTLSIVVLGFYIFAFGFCCYLFAIGFHNKDIGYNLRYLNAKHNMSFVDCASEDCFINLISNQSINVTQNHYNEFTAQEAYNLGSMQQGVAFWFGIFCMFIIGSGIQYFAERMEGKRK